MSNFMYQVMTNGIGGVNAGGVEGGYKYGNDKETKVNAKLLSILIKNRLANVDIGYLNEIITNTTYVDKEGKARNRKIKDYRLTTKAIRDASFIIKAYERKGSV